MNSVVEIVQIGIEGGADNMLNDTLPHFDLTLLEVKIGGGGQIIVH